MKNSKHTLFSTSHIHTLKDTSMSPKPMSLSLSRLSLSLCMCTPQCTSGGSRTASRSEFCPSITWVLWVELKVASRSGCKCPPQVSHVMSSLSSCFLRKNLSLGWGSPVKPACLVCNPWGSACLWLSGSEFINSLLVFHMVLGIELRSSC